MSKLDAMNYAEKVMRKEPRGRDEYFLKQELGER